MQEDFIPNVSHKPAVVVGICTAFLVGYLLPRPCRMPKTEFALAYSPIEDDVSAPVSSSNVHMDNLSKISSYGSERYACNTEFAYDELTRLHRKRENLGNHARKGDANRARTGTIQRKAAQSAAAESAFRICVKGMVPELLFEWDTQLENHGISVTWDERSEIKNDGITLDVLQSTADEMMTSQQNF